MAPCGSLIREELVNWKQVDLRRVAVGTAAILSVARQSVRSVRIVLR